MSGSDSETLCAIVVGEKTVTKSPRSVSKGEREKEREREREREREKENEKSKPGEKQCSGCRIIQPIDNFWGTQRNEGKEMRTCLSCRTKHMKSPANVSNSLLEGGIPESPNIEPTARNNRLTRRQATSNSAVAAASPSAASKPSTGTPAKSANKPPVATYSTRQQPLTRVVGIASPAPTPVTQKVPAREGNAHDDNTDTEEEVEYLGAPVLQSLKRQSTPPHSTSEDMDHEGAIQVVLPKNKRQRMNGLGSTPVVQRQIEPDQDAEVGEEVDEGEQHLNSNGNPVGSDLAAFAASLGRLSQLLVTAGKNLNSERIGALENEIHHDWRVDEMATFVEGFLKGASANSVSKGW